MRATWITSSIAGVVLALAIRLSTTNRLNDTFLFPLFLVLVVIAVIGLPQLRDIRRERMQSGEWLLCRKQDFTAFYFPAWGRMSIFGISCVLSLLVTKALGS